MRKAIAMIAAAMMLIAAGAAAEAAPDVKVPRDATISYEYVPETVYEVKIPQDIAIPAGQKTGTCTVEVTKAEYLPTQYLTIAVGNGLHYGDYGAGYTRAAAKVGGTGMGTDLLPYTITKDGQPVGNQLPFLMAASGITQPVTTELVFTMGDARAAGQYEDTLTFTIQFVNPS